MNTDEKIELKLTLIAEPNVTLRGLDTMRAELFEFLKKELSPETATISQPSPSRSLDPAVIGTIGLAVLPIVVDNLGDLIIKWAELRSELRKSSSVTIRIPIKGTRPVKEIIITYDPKTTSEESLSNMIRMAVDAAKSG